MSAPNTRADLACSGGTRSFRTRIPHRHRMQVARRPSGSLDIDDELERHAR